MSTAADSENIVTSPPTPGVNQNELYPRRKLHVPVVLVTLFWVMYLIFGMLDLPMFTRFLGRAGALLLLLLAFAIWWLMRGPVRVSYRILVLGWAVAGGIIVTLLMDRTVLPPSIYVLVLPCLFTAWTVWLFLSRHSIERSRLVGMLIIPALVWAPGALVRMEGLKGDGAADFHWRWNPSAEQHFIQQSIANRATRDRDLPQEPVIASAEDWTGFRGPQRDATLTGFNIGTDWKRKPPQLVWRTRVGPAWSSMVVVGERLFTQEQRGEIEVVTCFDTNTGKQLWVHDDPGRFEESLGGIGPRATPVFANNRIYALGAAGRLNCLDAASGSVVWSRDIVADASAQLPVWGFSGSPLVVDNRVIVFAGGKTQKALLAYDESSGDIAWTAAAGTESYTSPHLMELDGQPQILFIGNEHLTAYEPSSGKVIWTYKPDQTMARPVVQPRLVADSQLLVSFSPDAGVTRIGVTHNADKWSVTETWRSRDIKPDYSDFVHYDGYIYGFDGNIFCCVDLETGKRQWKKGRYGAGQVILLSDQQLLLVITEDGELVLVAADPKGLNELARFQAISGKTWNHPVISHGKLFVRNAEEMACFDLNPSF